MLGRDVSAHAAFDCVVGLHRFTLSKINVCVIDFAAQNRLGELAVVRQFASAIAADVCSRLFASESSDPG